MNMCRRQLLVTYHYECFNQQYAFGFLLGYDNCSLEEEYMSKCSGSTHAKFILQMNAIIM